MARLGHQVFTASGTYTSATEGWKKVIMVSGGGNGGNSAFLAEGGSNYRYGGGGGASGNVAITFVYMTAGETIPVTINAPSTVAAAAGASVSIGTLFTLAGGAGGGSASATEGNRKAGAGGIHPLAMMESYGNRSTAGASLLSDPIIDNDTAVGNILMVYREVFAPYLTPVVGKTGPSTTAISSTTKMGGLGGSGCSGETSSNGNSVGGGGGGGGWKTMFTGAAIFGEGGGGGAQDTSNSASNTNRANGTKGVVIIEAS